MLDESIRRMLAMSPRGMTSEQLLWRLRGAGLRPGASEILAALRGLVLRGEATRLLGRWQGRLQGAQPAGRPGTAAIRQDEEGQRLHAIPFSVRDGGPGPAASGTPATADDLPHRLPPWEALLGYYAATQRLDPRGRVTVFPDQHGHSWQMFSAVGRWWTQAELRTPTDSLPKSLPEALVRRQVQTAAIGWPLTVFREPTGTVCMPGLILPVGWRLELGELVIRVDAVRPAVNPDWLRAIRSRTSWSESLLLERLFPEGEPDDLAAVGERLRHAASSLVAGSLRPADLAPDVALASMGLHNGAALFLPEDQTFTRGVAEDLEALRTWEPQKRQSTALAAITGEADATETAGPIVSVVPLSESQLAAAAAAMDGRITLIQGPPGTGKSQVIVALIVSALVSGRSVLFAARNHRAIDEVEARLRVFAADEPLLVRARDREGERDASFLDAIRDIAAGRSRPETSDPTLDALRDAVLTDARRASEVRRRERDRTNLHLALSDLVERIAAIRHHEGTRTPPRPSFLRRLFRLLRRHVARRGIDLTAPVPEMAPLVAIEERIIALRRALAQSERAGTADPAPPNAEARVADLLRRLPAWIARPDEATRLALAARERELAFAQARSVRRLSEQDAQAVVRHRPVWAVSTLSVPARIPLLPNLFDLVIFDEASQCDIASALPLMARASRAVVVGDPQQLSFVPALGLGAEQALMDVAKLPHEGRARLAQSRNSLFDFLDALPSVQRMFLADQFRSSPQIVDYIGGEFYGGKLIARRNEDELVVPSGFRPGLAWEDVQGRTRRDQDGNINEAEAERVVALLVRLAADASFTGSVGVIAPFNAQVALIQRKVESGLSDDDRKKLGLQVGTVDRWQGGEADVVLFSLTIASGATLSARTFLQKERRRINVAISRARAVCIVVGDLVQAQRSGIRHIEFLATRATEPWSAPRPPFDSLWERRLDTAMRDRGLRPFPQYPVGRRYLDFALDPEGAKLDVEVDGKKWHLGPDGNRKTADRLRDAELTARGWKVLRFWVHELERDMGACVDRIERELVDK